MLSKNVSYKNFVPINVFFNEQNQKDSDDL